MLIGEGRNNGAFISAFRLNPLITDVEAGLAAVRPDARKNSGLIESTYAEEPFKTESGLTGVQASYTQKYWAGSLIPLTTHNFVFTNANSQYVVLRYHTAAGQESEEVERMIQKSLQTESNTIGRLPQALTDPL